VFFGYNFGVYLPLYYFSLYSIGHIKQTEHYFDGLAQKER